MLNLSKFKPEEKFFSMKETAQSLNKGRNRMMKFLRGQNVINVFNEPYQEYLENGCFKLVLKDIAGRSGAVIDCKPVSLVSAKGYAFIKKLYEKNGGVDGKA